MFGKGQKSFDEISTTVACENFPGHQEPSVGKLHPISGWKRTLGMLLKDNQVGDTNENIQQNKVNEQISEKIQELENCSAQTQETLHALLQKQNELANHIEQLRKLLREAANADNKANVLILK